MTYEEAKTAPLNYLVGYLASLYEDCECTCKCKWESWADPNDNVKLCKEYAARQERHCKEDGGYASENYYDTCPQRLAYERVMDAVEKQTEKRVVTVFDDNELGGVRYDCPTCGGRATTSCGDPYEDYDLGYCEHCGQKLNWDKEAG